MDRHDEQIRTRRPLVHCLTNPVSMNDVANALLAIGASPIMADDPIESAEVTARANALLLNLGMPSPAKLEAMLRSGVAARERGIPVVFDPVGVALTAFRQQAAARILAEVRPTVIRGNFSEISFLASLAAGTGADDPAGTGPVAEHAGSSGQSTREIDALGRGVDEVHELSRGVESTVAGSQAYTDELMAMARERAESVSRRYQAVTVLTGARDIVTDGRQTWVQAGGSAWLTRMTGAGCVLGGIIAAYMAVAELQPERLAEPVLAALQRFGSAAREAERRVLAAKSGSGSFRVHLIDSLG